MLAERVKKIFKSLVKEFIYGGHLQCLGLVGIAYISGFVLNIKVNAEVFLFIYLIFYPIYIYDRLLGVKTDESDNPERTEHLRKYIRIIPKIILFTVLVLAILLIYFSNLRFLIFSFILLFLGLLYPVYFKNLTKRIAAFKNFYVAAFFAIIALSPIIYYSYQLNFLSSLTLAVLMFFVAFKVVLMQILLDCKDVEGDKDLGLLTVPVLIGKERTFIFLKIFNAVITILILGSAVFLFRVFPIKMLSLVITVPVCFYSYNLARKRNYYGYIIGSSEAFLWLILILLAKTIL